MFQKINHIGLAVNDLDAYTEKLDKMFGAKVLKEARYEEAGQISRLVQCGDFQFELMQPLDVEGTIGKYLQKNKEGVHHISLFTDDFDDDCEKLQETGVKLLGVTELDGLRYSFTYPKTSGGVLYEIVGK